MPSFDLIVRDWLPKSHDGARQDCTLERRLLQRRGGVHAGDGAASAYRGDGRAQKSYFGVTATDVSLPALAVGRAGLYPRQKIEEIPPQYRENYCEAVDGDSFRIIESLRKRVGFASFNLLDLARAP